MNKPFAQVNANKIRQKQTMEAVYIVLCSSLVQLLSGWQVRAYCIIPTVLHFWSTTCVSMVVDVICISCVKIFETLRTTTKAYCSGIADRRNRKLNVGLFFCCSQVCLPSSCFRCSNSHVHPSFIQNIQNSVTAHLSGMFLVLLHM